MNRSLFLFVVAVLLTAVSPVRAGLIVTVQDVSIQAGTTGFVDVTIESDASLGDAFWLANYRFRIEQIFLTGSTLEFVAGQPLDWHSNPTYVFLGNTSLPAGGDDEGFGLTFQGGDFTADGFDVTVTGPKLLARLEVTTATSLPPSGGDKFRVYLDTASGDTFFLDSLGGSPSVEARAGTVTITPAPAMTAVPGPGAVVLLLSGGLTVGLARLVRRARAGEVRSRPC